VRKSAPLREGGALAPGRRRGPVQIIQTETDLEKIATRPFCEIRNI